MTLLRAIRRALAWILFGERDHGHSLPAPNSLPEWRYGRRCLLCLRHEEDPNFAQPCPRVRPNMTELA